MFGLNDSKRMYRIYHERIFRSFLKYYFFEVLQYVFSTSFVVLHNKRYFHYFHYTYQQSSYCSKITQNFVAHLQLIRFVLGFTGFYARCSRILVEFTIILEKYSTNDIAMKGFAYVFLMVLPCFYHYSRTNSAYSIVGNNVLGLSQIFRQYQKRY